jgi:hypothetical protein
VFKPYLTGRRIDVEAGDATKVDKWTPGFRGELIGVSWLATAAADTDHIKLEVLDPDDNVVQTVFGSIYHKGVSQEVTFKDTVKFYPTSQVQVVWTNAAGTAKVVYVDFEMKRWA